MDFDLRQLEIFCRVVELGSFSQAAKAVHLAQASVSERIATLEQAVGTRLLDRLGRETRPTKAGELLYQRAVGLLKMKQEIALEMESFLGIRRGTISVGGSTIPGDYILPDAIRRFREKFPEIMVQLCIADTDEIVSRVSDGVLEIGLVGSKGKAANLSFTELWKDELVLVVPGSHRWSRRRSVSFAEVRREPFIHREPGSGTQQILEKHLKEIHPSGTDGLNVVAVLNSSNAVKEGIKAGLGVSIISSRAVATEVRSGILRQLKIKGLSLHRSFYLVRDKRRTLSPLCRAFADFLSAEATSS